MEFIVPRKYKETVDNYNQVELIYKDYKIEFRIYNDGVAYRFVSTANNKQPVKKESVSFRFGQDHTSYTLLTACNGRSRQIQSIISRSQSL